MRIGLICFTIAILAEAGCANGVSKLPSWMQAKPSSSTLATQDKHESEQSFSMVASNDGTFLVNQSTGKVWKFEAKENAFLEIPVTSKILSYNPKAGRLEPDKGLNNSGKPCDKKSDPLCIM